MGLLRKLYYKLRINDHRRCKNIRVRFQRKIKFIQSVTSRVEAWTDIQYQPCMHLLRSYFGQNLSQCNRYRTDSND